MMSLTWIFLSSEFVCFVAGEITQALETIPWQCFNVFFDVPTAGRFFLAC